MDWIKLWTTSSEHSRRRIKVEARARCKWSIVDIVDTHCRQELLLRPDWVRGLPLRLLHVPHQLRAGGAPPPPRPPGRRPVRLLRREESVACNKLAVVLSFRYQCSITMIKRSNKCTYQILLCMICISARNRPILGGRYLGHSSRRPRPGLEAAGAGAGCIDSPQLLASRSRQDSRTLRGPAAGMDHYCGHYI